MLRSASGDGGPAVNESGTVLNLDLRLTQTARRRARVCGVFRVSLGGCFLESCNAVKSVILSIRLCPRSKFHAVDEPCTVNNRVGQSPTGNGGALAT